MPDAPRPGASAPEPAAQEPELRLRLFVLKDSTKSTVAVRNLRRILDAELPGRYSLEIIDVREHPEAAETDRIIATPTLLRISGGHTPAHRIIGDMSDTEKVLLGLGIGPLSSLSQRGLV